MPLPNEHSARLREPGDFKERPDWGEEGQFRRTQGGSLFGGNLVVPETIGVIWGQLRDQSGEQAAAQALRFPISDWTEAQARKWLEDHNVAFISFEPAEPAANPSNPNPFSASSAPSAMNVDLFWNQAGPTEQWVMVAQVGQWRGHPSGPYEITSDRIASMLDFFNERYRANNADLVVDYDHATLRPGQQAIAAGWISRLEVRNAGAELWAKVRWNSQASEFLGRREYRYLSPVFRFEYPDPVTGRKWPAALESVALTNTPFLTELPAVANQSGRTAGETDPAAQSEEGGMKDLLKLLGGIWANSVADAARFLGLAENAADEDVLKAVAAKAKDAAANKAGADRAAVFANALGVKPDADDKAISTTIAALKAPALSLAVVANALGLAPDSKPEDMAKQISDLRGQAADTKAERLIANAVEGKKIPPALRDWWIKRAKEDLPGTETIVNALPAILSEPSRGAAGSAPIVNLTDSETALANSLGVAQSDFAADKAEFSRSRELQDEFRSVETYLAYRGAERQGRVRVVGATKV